MNELIQLTAAEAAEKLASGEITSVELTQAHLDRIAATDGAPLSDNRADGKSGLNAFLHVNAEEALATAAAVDADRAAGKELPPLAGVPIAVKDLIVTKGQPTTAASRMLAGWMSPYDGTVTRKVREARMPILGKTNLDEFAMGSSNEHSAFGVVRNPWALDRAPGGSGGGSAAAVTAFQAPLALGTDTGGSIRQPAALTGSVGVKPTYGSVSRYGVIAMASSLDQVGPVARTVLDTAMLHEVIAGHDPLDSTSLPDTPGNFAEEAKAGAEAARKGDLSGLRVGVIKELGGPRSDLSDYREVWIVVDHDGRDRHDFLAACRRLSSKRTVVHGVVAVPCFEVWLNAHYAPVKNYQNQADAQTHYRELTGLSSKDAKMLPDDFPWGRGAQAAARCHLPTDSLPEADTQGPCPSTTMPHLLRSLELLSADDL